MSIPAELRNARMLVNRGHGDVSDEPDPLHEAADQYDAECTCGAAGNLLASQMRENNDVEVLIHVLMHQSDANDLDAVVHELGIENSDKTPADAVRDLREQLANARSDAALFTEHEKAERRRELEKVRP
jgi:hypothetical protein